MRTLPVYSTSALSGSCIWNPAVASMSEALLARPACCVVLMTVTLIWEGGTGLALWVGHGTSPTSAYLIFSEKPLPKGMGRSPVNTRAANTAATIIATPMMENVVF